MARGNSSYPHLEVPRVKVPLSPITMQSCGSDGDLLEEHEFFIKFFIPEDTTVGEIADVVHEYRKRNWKNEIPNIMLVMLEEQIVVLRGDITLSLEDVQKMILDVLTGLTQSRSA